MTALHLATTEPDEPTLALLRHLITRIGIHAFCELVAAQFGLGPTSGEQTIEMRFEHGQFRWARTHSGRLGLDDLQRMGE